jgi:hypothetical protein
MEDEKPEGDDNAQTIRPNRSPAGPGTIPLARAPSADIVPIVEDYSDIATEEDELLLQEKVADFKVSAFLFSMLLTENSRNVEDEEFGAQGTLSS